MKFRHINFEKIVAATVLFISAWNETVPIDAATEIPWIFRPIQVIYGTRIEQFILILILPTIFITNQFKNYLTNRYTNAISMIFWALGFIGLLSSCFNFVNILEFGESIRLILFGFFLIWLEQCAIRFGTEFCLRCVIFGLAIGGAVNIFFSFHISNTVGIIPLLIGQAGPGPPLGLLVIVSAWAYSITTKNLPKTIYVITCIIGIYGGIASWSKISLLLIITGLIPWAILILSRPRKIKIVLIILILTIGLIFKNDSSISEIKDSVDQIIFTKLSSEDHNLNNPDSKIWGERFVFHIAVLEIVASHPLLGVGYAGFGTAYKETAASKMQHAYNDEFDQIQSSQSNPHSTWLYYASANGILGLILVFFWMLNISFAFYNACKLAPKAGRSIGFAIIAAIFIWSISVPTILQSSLTLSLVGIACATQRRPAHLAVRMTQGLDKRLSLMRN